MLPIHSDFVTTPSRSLVPADLSGATASDILELESGALVPTVFVVSNQDGVITVDVPDGLFDLD